jgi:hypothetical protein
MIKNRTFPYGYFPSSSGKKFAAYPVGKNPDINTKGYKLAHIFSAGENYSDSARYKGISKFCNVEFPRGVMADWSHHTLSNGKHYRRIDIDDNQKAATVRAFAVAHFLRAVHPINYFLVPMTTGREDKESKIKKTNIYWYDYDNGGQLRDEIGEYPKLIEYVAAKIKDEYRDTNVYQEFLELIFPVGNCIDPKGENVQIDAEYAIDIWKKKIGDVTMDKNIEKVKSVQSNSIDFSAFKNFTEKEGMKSDYRGYLRNIIRELCIETIEEFEECIDEIVEYCTRKINESKDKKEQKKYSDIRAALRKYKEYLCREKGDALFLGTEDKLYIHYKKGWSSWEPVGKHVVEYYIEGDTITISYNVNFSFDKTNKKQISAEDMKELLSILNEAIRSGALEKSGTSIRTVHEPIGAYGYDYEYLGKSGTHCGTLFTDSSLISRYNKLIDKITK